MADYMRGPVWQYLADRGDWVRRGEVAGKFRLDPDAASKHLQRLVEDRFVEARGFTTAREYRAITKYGPPGDRRTQDFREGGTAEGSARYRRQKAARLAGKAKTKGRRVVRRVACALEMYWRSAARV